jgi:hypothetical protein
MFFGKEDAAKNVFFGILQGDFIPEIFSVTAGGVGLSNGANGGGSVAAQALNISHHETAFNFYVVMLLKVGPVFQHFGGEIAVVGEKNQAAGVIVQTADRVDALW